MKQCANGHFFDDTRHASCPYCASAQQPVSAPFGGGKTVPLANAAPDAGKTVPLSAQPASPFSVGKTVPLAGIPSDAGKTVGLMQQKTGIDPAVGFVVCIEGPHRGADFRLRAGRNFIGRDPSMDVSLTDDVTVSRDSHALISFDNRHNTFILSPSQGRGLTYLNNEPIESAVTLRAYDRIEVGSTKLIFLPLCSDEFSWES